MTSSPTIAATETSLPRGMNRPATTTTPRHRVVARSTASITHCRTVEITLTLSFVSSEPQERVPPPGVAEVRTPIQRLRWRVVCLSGQRQALTTLFAHVPDRIEDRKSV